MLTRLEFAGASCRLHRTLLASGPVRKSEKEACRDERDLCKNVLDYVTRRLNASSAVLKKLAGLDLCWDRRFTRLPDPNGTSSQPNRGCFLVNRPYQITICRTPPNSYIPASSHDK